jgi:hypothetical protein
MYDSQTLESLAECPYEGINTTGAKGLDPATIASLKALGAIEDEEVSETVE